MPEKKDIQDPSTTSLAYDSMIAKWAKIDTLLGGTDAMRNAGTLYLPQHTEEDDGAYGERLSRSTLFNVTKITLNEMVGKPFGDPIKINDDVSSQIQPLLENVDLLGNNLDVFARNWFRDGFGKALSHVLVDFPRIQQPEDGRPRTLADDQQENIRPYWVHIPPENVIFARSEIINGAEVLQHVRILETVTEQVGFAEVAKVRIRVLEPGLVQIWEPTKQKKRNKVVWEKVDEFIYDLNFIPLVTFYADRQDFMTGDLPLNDLADLNIQHWQSESDQIAVLTVARFPMLALSGSPPTDNPKLKIGPRKWLHTSDVDGKYYYVEHTGKAIGAGRQDLMDIEERMSSFGSQILKKRPGNTTATARALDSAEMTSPLEDAVIRFTDSVNLALSYTAAWLNLDRNQGGTVVIKNDFGDDVQQAADLKTLIEARKLRDISRKTLLNEMKLRGTLNDEFNEEDNEQDLEKELMTVTPTQTDLDPGSTDNEDDDFDDPDKFATEE